jgi:DNA processing protein
MEITPLVALSLAGVRAAKIFMNDPDADPLYLLRLMGFPKSSGHIACVYGENPVDAAEKIVRRCEKSGYIITSITDTRYPALLREIPDPPLVLYSSGEIPRLPIVSIVGTRRSDPLSETVTRRIAYECAEKGLCVASGMAVGIDRAAHLGALETGITIAVLPNGVDKRYPSVNIDVCNRIVRSAVSILLSEFPPGVRCDTWTFVRRNRIISGLSAATAVMKAGLRSGAMITANHALEQGRDVFACGGMPYDDGYAGCQKLIRDGAGILSSSDDLCVACGVVYSADVVDSRLLFNDPVSEKIGYLLNKGMNDIDTISRELSLPVAEVRRVLVSLELDGRVIIRGGKIFPNRGKQ